MALKLVDGKLVSDESLPETVSPVVGTETSGSNPTSAFVANESVPGDTIPDNASELTALESDSKESNSKASEEIAEPLPPKPVMDPAQMEINDELRVILHEYGGLESNIPVGHKYWNLLNQYRANQKKF